LSNNLFEYEFKSYLHGGIKDLHEDMNHSSWIFYYALKYHSY